MFLNHRSALRCNHPTDAKMFTALAYILAAIPLTAICFFVLLTRRIKRESLTLIVLDLRGEFSKFVKYMETLRRISHPPMANDVVLALSNRPHKTLSNLYSNLLGVRIIWGGSVSSLVQQALLLQPRFLVSIRRDISYLNPKPYRWSVVPIPEPSEFTVRRSSILKQLGVEGKWYVAISVYSPNYEAERNPQSMEKVVSLVTKGEELAPSIDYLRDENLQPILLGSLDAGSALVPRTFPRLVDHFPLGSGEEVVLAAGCHYFWTDNVGAWWLGQPFQRPIMYSNTAVLPRTGLLAPNHLMLFVRYRLPDGRLLTLRELCREKKRTSFYKAASRGEIQLVRNSPEVIVDAHREMIARLDRTWTDDEETVELRSRLETIFLEFPDIHPVRIPSLYLRVNSDLLN